MKKSTYLSLIAVSLVNAGLMLTIPVVNASTPAVSMQQANLPQPYSAQAFTAAQQSGQPFLVAFHKKGCSMCVAQQNALDQILTEPQFKNVRILVVDYNNDTASLQQFKVGRQGTLILFKGSKEINRSDALTKAVAIEKQLQG